jgi:hypothetical protein
VNIAFPAQFAGVQAGYTIDATTVNSSTVAAAVDAGAGVGVALGELVGEAPAVLVAFPVGLDVDPQDTSIATISIGAARTNLPKQLTRRSRSWTCQRPDSIKVAAP